MNNTIFLSLVTSEFGSWRKELADMIASTKRLHVRHQDDFAQRGVKTLQMLEEEIQCCDAVIHVIGADEGWKVPVEQAKALLARQPEFSERYPDVAALGRLNEISATQWEAWLTLFLGKRLCSYELESHTSQNPAQREHAARLRAYEEFPKVVDSNNALRKELYATVGELERLWRENNSPPPLHLPTSFNLPLIGRKDDVANICNTFVRANHENQRLRIVQYGLGGVGKSRLAIEAGHAYNKDGHAVLFIRSIDHEVFERDIESLAEPLDVGTNEVKHWLRKNDDWLLIFDGVDDEQTQSMVLDFCGGFPTGHFLITSCLRTGWDQRFSVGEVRSLSEESAHTLFLHLLEERGRKTRVDEEKDIDELSKMLGGLPLAIEQAAGYLVSTMSGFDRYLRLLKSLDQEAIDYSGRLTDAKEPIARTWRATFDRLPSEGRTLLRLLSYMTDDPIPSGLLANGPVVRAFQDACASDPFERGRKGVVRRSNRISLSHALKALSDFSLISWVNDNNDRFQLHRLVLAVTQAEMQRFGRSEFWVKGLAFFSALIGRSWVPSDTDRRQFITFPVRFISEYLEDHGDAGWNDIYPHAFRLLSLFGDDIRNLESLLRLNLNAREQCFLADVALRRRGAQDVKDALRIAQSALKQCTEDVRLECVIKRIIAACYFDLVRPHESIEVATDALTKLWRAKDSQDSAWKYAPTEIIRLLDKRGWCYRCLGNCNAAIDDYKTAHDLIRKHEVDECHADVLAGLGGSYDYAGDYTLAEQYYRQSVESAKATEDICSAGYNLYLYGWFLIRNGDPASGRAMCDESARIGLDYEFDAIIHEASWIRAIDDALQGKLSSALKMIDLAIEHDQDLTSSWVKMIRGFILLRLGKPEDAKEDFEFSVADIAERLRNSEDNFELLDTLAFSQAGLGLCGDVTQFDLAQETYAKARGFCSAKGVLDINKTVFSLAESSPSSTELWKKLFENVVVEDPTI